ncbi:MAG: transcription antitermination factor NusB [Bacteroidota bacterium]
MLNRRTLRIKAMQVIFAFQQCREANFNVVIERIGESFLPDLNSMEKQDLDLLNQQKKEAVQIFKEQYSSRSFDASKGSKEDKINTVVDDSISFYHQQVDKDMDYFRKNMVIEAEKIHDRYILALLLIIEFAEIAEGDKKRNHSNFVKNLLIRALKENKALENVSLRRNLKWKDRGVDVRQWFMKLIKSDDTYLDYISKDNPDFEYDKAIVLHILKNVIFKSESIGTYWEEEDLNWAEDKAIVKSLSTKTVKSIEEDTLEGFELQELSYNWEDDKSFFIKLFDDTVKVEEDYLKLVDEKAKNWDIDRIAGTDKVILEMAIGEMINFQSIPVKVTINEYIEISKGYSTPKSKQFVNGILDVVAVDLQNKGVIKKSGRGLIDNK